MITTPLPGVVVPLATPFRDDGSLAVEVVASLVEFLLAAGITGLVAAGTTGEGYALATDERRLLIDAVVIAAAGRVPVLVGVGGTATREALAQARMARDAGAVGLMVAAPAYCLPTSAELATHVLAVVDEVGLPTVLYDYPARTGVPFDATVLELIAAHPHVVGIKEASGDLGRVSMLRDRFGEQLSTISGSDTLAMHYFEAGARSWIAGFGNVLPEEHVAMLTAATAGDMAAGWAVQERLTPILTNAEAGRYNAKVKAGLQLRGVPVGPTRAPMASLADPELSALRAQLAALGHT